MTDERPQRCQKLIMLNMELPLEILIYIFKFLPHGDRLAAGATCRYWNHAACARCFLNKQYMCFTKSILKCENLVRVIFSTGNCRKFENITFRQLDFRQLNINKVSAIWRVNGPNIRSIDFDECEISEKMFVNILNSCPNLESLSFSVSKELRMSASLLDGKLQYLDCNNLKHLKRLKLSKNYYFSDIFVNQFICTTDTLEELDISDCCLNLKKKFSSLPESLNFSYIYKFFETKGQTLKKICVNKTLIDDEALTKISELHTLNLSSFQAYGCDRINKDGIFSLTSHQSNLTELNLGDCTEITDDFLTNICRTLKNLKSLNISKCDMITNIGAVELNNLKKLERLDISRCNLVTSEGLRIGICKEINKVLTELNISALILKEYVIIHIAEKIPNLKILNMELCFTSVTNHSIQYVFKNLLYLHTLCINYCETVTDDGLTGLETGEIYPIDHFSFDIRNEDAYDIPEEVLEYKDKKFTINGYPLSRLKNLRCLNMSGLNKITDFSLQFAFKNVQLKTLFLNDCDRITSDGLHFLTKNCPSIEKLALTNCSKICDNGIKNITTRLNRLTHLYLRGCELLTVASIKSVLSECKALKVLDVQSCRNITPELEASLNEIPSLHTLHILKLGTYINGGENMYKFIVL